ncbi:heterokaryon incompatibility protein-domain-containing protein [Annulohypoxylon nitens]|nr:heterokaryon incompatibility protein-domain-containing protein [Annulohypoxylon nitens]
MHRLLDESRFQYVPLSDSQTSIRLVEVHGLDENPAASVSVLCRLDTFSLDQTPPYHAISYTWGDPSQTTWIRVNGALMEVRQNCEYVLKQAWWHGGCRYHWVDAICINQDDMNEKTDQVQIMGQVYQGAVNVLACVGQHDDGSEFLFRKLRKRYQEWQAVIQVSNTRELYHIRSNFLRRPYFSRVWVAQELFLARQVLVCCGRGVIPLANLIVPLQAMTNREHYGDWYLRPSQPSQELNTLKITSDVSTSKIAEIGFALPNLKSKYGSGGIRNQLCLKASRWLWFRRLVGLEDFVPNFNLILQLGRTGHRLLNLRDAIILTQPLQCQDARDHVYGILSLINWEGKDPIMPDYSSSAFELAVKTVRKCIEMHKSTTLRHDDSDISIAKTITYMLGLYRDNDDLRAARDKRRQIPPPFIDMPLDQLLEKCQGCGCLGWYIVYDNGWKLSNKPDWNDKPSLSDLIRIELPHSNAYITVTSAVQPGDRLITPDSKFDSDHHICLVIRQSNDGEISIVGQGIRNKRGSTIDIQPAALFQVYFDPEDLIVLITGSEALGETLTLDEKLDYLDHRVCRYKGSTRVEHKV